MAGGDNDPGRRSHLYQGRGLRPIELDGCRTTAGGRRAARAGTRHSACDRSLAGQWTSGLTRTVEAPESAGETPPLKVSILPPIGPGPGRRLARRVRRPTVLDLALERACHRDRRGGEPLGLLPPRHPTYMVRQPRSMDELACHERAVIMSLLARRFRCSNPTTFG